MIRNIYLGSTHTFILVSVRYKVVSLALVVDPPRCFRRSSSGSSCLTSDSQEREVNTIALKKSLLLSAQKNCIFFKVHAEVGQLHMCVERLVAAGQRAEDERRQVMFMSGENGDPIPILPLFYATTIF